MKTLKKLMILLICFVITNQMFSQNDLKDLVDEKATYTESELINRGYNFVQSEISGERIYSYWWSSKRGKCVIISTQDGRTASVAEALATSCYQEERNNYNESEANRNSNHNGGNNDYEKHAIYNDLVGWNATSAHDELKARGFREVTRYQKDRLWIVWEHRKTGKCIKTGEEKSDIKEIKDSDKCK